MYPATCISDCLYFCSVGRQIEPKVAAIAVSASDGPRPPSPSCPPLSVWPGTGSSCVAPPVCHAHCNQVLSESGGYPLCFQVPARYSATSTLLDPGGGRIQPAPFCSQLAGPPEVLRKTSDLKKVLPGWIGKTKMRMSKSSRKIYCVQRYCLCQSFSFPFTFTRNVNVKLRVSWAGVWFFRTEAIIHT